MESPVKAIEQFICESHTRIAELKSEIATLQAENAELDDTLTSLTPEEREFDKTARTLQERLWKSQESGVATHHRTIDEILADMEAASLP